MPLRAVRSSSNEALWRAFSERFLAELGDCTGPVGYPAHAWVTHRIERDALFAEAARLGMRGWLSPPISFFSDFPRLFDLRLKPLSPLRRRLVIAEIAQRRGLEHGFQTDTRFDRRGIEDGLDRFIGELLPEGVKAGRLRRALEAVSEDEFAARRSQWVAAVYEDYLEYLASQKRFDPRAIHGFVSSRIADGHLAPALGGAKQLHVYGVTSLRTRRRLIAALGAQDGVDVVLYLPVEEELGELDTVTSEVEELPGGPEPQIEVQPAPDDRREMEFVALSIKKLLQESTVLPHEIAVVARVGREDTRRAHETLSRAGIPTTARIRSQLAEVPALKAVLHLFRAAARNWAYRPLRHVLESAYFDLDIDLRSVDYLAREKRIEDLGTWFAELTWLRHSVESAEGAGQKGKEGIFADRLGRDVSAFHEFLEKVHVLEDAKPVSKWVEITRKMVQPGWFGFRKRVCHHAGGRWDVVRLDQSALGVFDRLLQEWDAEAGGESPVSVQDWYARLRRFLSTNEIALSTPMRRGVQILEAHEAASFPFKHTFVVHANDGEFPSPSPVSTLFSPDEREAMATERRIPISTRDNHLRRERSLWRAVCANPHVVVSYRTADANGVPLLPSLMVPEHDPATEIPRTQFTWTEPFNESHAELAAISSFAEGRKEGVGGNHETAYDHAVRHAILGAHAESQRRESASEQDRPAGMPGPWNGSMRDPWVLEQLAEQFGHDRVWSASQLELYARCPFVYLMQRVLRLDELAEAEEHTSALTFGSLAHTILERFYREYNGSFPAEFGSDSVDTLERLADLVFREAENDRAQWLGLPALWAVTKHDLLNRVAQYLRYELPLFTGTRPFDHEFTFGMDGADPVEIKGVDVGGREAVIKLRGRIDRVDVTEGDPGALQVVDYKSGARPRLGWYKDGSALQAPLYMEALQTLTGRTIDRGLYRSIKRRTQGAIVKWGDLNFERSLRIALSIPGRIRAGLFEPRASKSGGWESYWPDIRVTRVNGIMRKGARFDE